MPYKFQKATDWVEIQKYLFWYWINKDELISCINSYNSGFRSDDFYFIEIDGIRICNDREEKDDSALNKYWLGME